MPRYDYQCANCQNKFEVRQSFSSEPVAACPNCDNDAQRVINSVPIVFKGSGFYVNDYGKGKGSTASTDSKTASDNNKTPDSAETKTSATESDSKSETKSVESKSTSDSDGTP